jgi:ribonuclease D
MPCLRSMGAVTIAGGGGQREEAGVQYESITEQEQLEDYCRRLAGAAWVAFDSEFVAEHTYRPVLCLVQVAAPAGLAVIDALAVDDVTPFWELIASPGRETVVHAGRSEVEFCLQAVGRAPSGPFDVQIAAGLAGIDYPAGYSTLLVRVLGKASKGHETRTDWRRRPLSQRQIEYALEDVRHLRALRDALRARLVELGRLAWMAEEMDAWQAEIREALSGERWRRISGTSGLGRRELAVARELYLWREAEAQRRDQPVRRVLRDDLIVELARRKSAHPKQIRAVRGMERGDLLRRLGEVAACIDRALRLPDDQCPLVAPRQRAPELAVLGQFLFAALGSICRQAHLAPGLVGGPNDIRDLVAHRTGHGNPGHAPRLARGWRREFVGQLFEDLLAGKIAIRVVEPDSDHPLRFERLDGGR